MEVRRRTGHRMPGEEAPRGALAVDRVGVGRAQPGREMLAADARATVPEVAVPLRLVFDPDVARDQPSSTREHEREIVALRAELELEVAIGLAEQEELDDLEVPESFAASGSGRGRRIAVVGRVDLDFDRACAAQVDAQVDAREFVAAKGPAVPGPANLESKALHVYAPPEAEGPTQAIDGMDERDVNEADGAQGRDRGWLDGNDTQILPAPVRAAFAELAGPIRLRATSSGLINQSFHVRAGDVEYLLQRVSDIFAPEIQENIQSVTAYLAARGHRVARLLPTTTGALSASFGELGRWRLMEHLGGASFDTLESVSQARSAAVLVGRFHAALLDFDRPIAPMGIPYRNTPLYLAALRDALERHRDHRLYDATARLAVRLFEALDAMGTPPAVQQRVIHGDLKLSNVLFESAVGPGRDRAFALIDFDTLMRGTLWMELGDAWRSWCNSGGEDAARPRFDLEVFAASCEGFSAGYGAPLDQAEIGSLETGPERITLELCARFAADALEESYWGWDPGLFPARGEHNIARAEGQWQLYEAERATAARRRELLRRLA